MRNKLTFSFVVTALAVLGITQTREEAQGCWRRGGCRPTPTCYAAWPVAQGEQPAIPFQGEIYDIDCDHGNEDCQMIFDPSPIVRTSNRRLVSIAIAAFEKAPKVVRGTYRQKGPENQLVSLECSVAAKAKDVVHGVAFSETDNFAKVWIGGYSRALKVRAYDLQQICESSFRTAKPLHEVSVMGDELKRAKLNSKSP